jgi:hypothetical protein
MTDTIRDARRRQLIAAVSMLSVSLGMSSAAVADQIKGEAGSQKVTGSQSAQKHFTQVTHKGGPLIQATHKHGPLNSQSTAKQGPF